ncbi:MAG: aminotransferase class III-fold pyridoxal phosphate-dependent enzyme [Bacteroidetes bacterium]|nr:aminotransferase class III-fold pyridoxal phosphate-dependent enzyme [Bacteroidota bacterium]
MLADGFDWVVDLKKSQGSYLYDSRTNRKMLDYFTFFASSALGMNHPKLTDPAFVQKLGLIAVNKPSNSDAYTVEMAEFVETFARLAQPSYMPYAFFIDGGALAVENAIKAAFDWKVRKNFAKGYTREVGHQVVHFRRAFHGRSGYTLALTNTDPTKTNYFPKFQWPRIHNPALRFPITEQILVQVKKEEALAIAQIKQAIVDNRDDIAALIIEPIQAEGGDNHFRKEFLIELRITGKLWAHEHFVQPDMMTFGKKTHICGFMCSKRIDEVEENVFKVPSRINSTFGGNLVDMVRCARTLEIIEEEGLIEHARVVGDYLHEQLLSMQRDYPTLVSNARGRGLLCAFDLPSAEVRQNLREKADEKGMILIGCGERSIRFRPPLNLTKAEVDEGSEIIRAVFREMSKS